MTEEILEKESSQDGTEHPLSASENVAEPMEMPVASEKEPGVENDRERIEGKFDKMLVQAVPAVSVSSIDEGRIVADAKDISIATDEESKVQRLLDLANAKGVAYAVGVAKKLDDYYALDRMHDELADKLYDGLVTRGLIRKE